MLEIIAVLGTITSLFLISENLLTAGFFVGIMASILWIIHGKRLTAGGNGIIVVNIILLLINIKGLI